MSIVYLKNKITEKGDVLNKVREFYIVRNFSHVLERWADEEAYPYIRNNWPRPFWPPLAPITIANKRAKGFPLTPLIRTERLFNAATNRNAAGSIFELTMATLKFGVGGGTVPYAAFQHEGGEIYVENKEGKAHIVYVPPRPWDEIPGEVIEKLKGMLDEAARGKR